MSISGSKAQKERVMSEFMNLTNAIPADTARLCKKAGYRLEVAIEMFYRDGAAQINADRAVRTRKRALGEEIEGLLNTQFNDYEDGDDSKRMEMEGLIKYLETLGLSPEEPSVICLAQLVQAPRLGIIERQGFCEGWTKAYLEENEENEMTGVNRLKTQEDLIQFQKSHIESLSNHLKEDEEYFQLIYRYVFDFGKDEGQKSFALETAIAFWEMLIPLAPTPDGHPFKHEYLEWWFQLLRSKGKAVSRDTWNLFGDFVEQFDDGFTNYDESGAWPSMIDDYVELARTKVGSESMDTS
ncbi:Cullin binding-domain-containing protein [Melampsora americana]|nr:Cullin binding-domain-containing protein [Melampsora americana]